MYVLKILLQIIFDILKRRQYPEISNYKKIKEGFRSRRKSIKTILSKNYKCKLKDYSTFFKMKVKYNTHERKLKKKNERRDKRKKGIRKKIKLILNE